MDGPATDLTALYRRFGPLVWAYLRRRMGGADEADDALQETFLAVARDPEAVATARSPRAWLLGVARNIARGRTRAAIRRRNHPLPEDYPAAPPAAEDSRLEDMRRAIDRLPEGQREVLALRLQQELSYEEIAEALDIPVGTVRSRLHHAVRRLQEWAEEAGGRPGVAAAGAGRPTGDEW
jgi:RNA polymerase sigma-70 factor (ECF subfamily)